MIVNQVAAVRLQDMGSRMCRTLFLVVQTVPSMLQSPTDWTAKGRQTHHSQTPSCLENPNTHELKTAELACAAGIRDKGSESCIMQPRLQSTVVDRCTITCQQHKFTMHPWVISTLTSTCTNKPAGRCYGLYVYPVSHLHVKPQTSTSRYPLSLVT